MPVDPVRLILFVRDDGLNVVAAAARGVESAGDPGFEHFRGDGDAVLVCLPKTVYWRHERTKYNRASASCQGDSSDKAFVSS